MSTYKHRYPLIPHRHYYYLNTYFLQSPLAVKWQSRNDSWSGTPETSVTVHTFSFCYTNFLAPGVLLGYCLACTLSMDHVSF